MKDNRNIFINKRRPQIFFLQEDDLKFLKSFFVSMKAGKLSIEDNLTFREMEDDLNSFGNGRRPQLFS
jgi:hypothetical protein